MNYIRLLVGIGAIFSGYTLLKYGLRSTSIAKGILQLVAGLILLGGGGYTIITVFF